MYVSNEWHQTLRTRSNPHASALRHYLGKQLALGFRPHYFLTWHYINPGEYRQQRHLLLDVKGLSDAAHLRRRSDPEIVSKDCLQIRNRLQRHLWGIKRLHQTWKHNEPPMLFFHELGAGEQLHTHLLIPTPAVATYDSREALLHYCNDQLRSQCSFLSRDRTIDVRPIDNSEGLIDYLLKEANGESYSFDAQVSTVLIPSPTGPIPSSACNRTRPYRTSKNSPSLPPLPPSRTSGSTWRVKP